MRVNKLGKKRACSICLDEELIQTLKKCAENESRSFSNLVETVLKRSLKDKRANHAENFDKNKAV